MPQEKGLLVMITLNKEKKRSLQETAVHTPLELQRSSSDINKFFTDVLTDVRLSVALFKYCVLLISQMFEKKYTSLKTPTF